MKSYICISFTYCWDIANFAYNFGNLITFDKFVGYPFSGCFRNTREIPLEQKFKLVFKFTPEI